MKSSKTLIMLTAGLLTAALVGCGTPTQEDSAPPESAPSGVDAITGNLGATLGPWGGHSNGRIPLTALSRVDYPGIQLDVFPNSLSGLYLNPDAAVAMLAMLKEYNRQTGNYLHPNEGYRTYDGQVYWKNYWTAQGKPGNAATPGYSNHGWGQAVDLNLSAEQSRWLGTYAARYGYTRSSSESWHYDYTGGYSGGGSSSCGSLSTSSTESDGIPGPNYWKLLQCFAAKRGGYTGPIDGAPGFYSYSGLQRAASAGFGYTGAIDGSFSVGGYSNGGLALQKVAAAYGYTGPQDGIPGPNTYKRSAAYFNYLWLNHHLD